MRWNVLCSLILVPSFVSACNCLVSRSACQEVASSNLVFIGTVEAIQPAILNEWRTEKPIVWTNDPEVIALKKSASESALNRLKERYLTLFFDLPANEKLHIQAAATQQQLQQVMDWIITQGTQIRFSVKQLVRRVHEEDDPLDSPSGKEEEKTAGKQDDDDEKHPESFSIWNEPGSCGIPFQTGETYLVYATDDEETGRMETNVCHRTARISDAGDDLAYVYLNRNGDANTARLEGFVTSEIRQLQQDRFHYKERIGSPVNDVVIELKSNQGRRYSHAEEGGRFVFDGLPTGDYQLFVFDDRGFPKHTEQLAGPKQIRVAKGECAITTLLVLTTHEDR